MMMWFSKRQVAGYSEDLKGSLAHLCHDEKNTLMKKLYT